MSDLRPTTALGLALALVAAAAAPRGDAVAQQTTPPPTPPATPAPGPGIGPFRDIEELSLTDLLDRRVSIASAGRVQRVEEAPSVVSVITDEDIRRMGARSVSDVLRTVPGFDVVTNSYGLAEIVVRGKRAFEDANVLLLLNGQRLNDASVGHGTFFNRFLPLGNVRQIEVIRGPGSAVYGAYAFAGVVNIVTYTAETFSGVQVAAQAGSFGTRQASLVSGHAFGALSVGTGLEAIATDGPRPVVRADLLTVRDRLLPPDAGLPAASLAPRAARDAGRTLHATLTAAYRGTALSAYARGDRMRGGYLGFFDILPEEDTYDTRTLGGELAHRFALGAGGGVRLSASAMQTSADSHLTPLPPGYANVYSDGHVLVFPDGAIYDYTLASRRGEASAVADHSWGRSDQLVVGATVQREGTFHERAAGNYDWTSRVALPDVVPAPPLIPKSRRTIASAFFQESWNPWASLGLTAGVRHDHYSDFGGTTNPRLGVVWRVTRDAYAKALYGRAFKAPTFEMLYEQVPTIRNGAPDLRPATIATRELAVGWARPGARIGANWFMETARDIVVAAYDSTVESPLGGAAFTFANGDVVRTRGVELEARRSFGLDHAVFANYTFQSARMGAGDFGPPPDVPRTMLNAGGTLGLTRHLSATLTVLHRGPSERGATDYRRDPTLEEAVRLGIRARAPGYTVARLNVRLLNLWDTFELAGTVDNLFDTAYAYPSVAGAPLDYPQAGRAVYLKAGYRF